MFRIGIPGVLARISSIRDYDLQTDYGFLPRPRKIVGLVHARFEEFEEAGYSIYLGVDPIEIFALNRGSGKNDPNARPSPFSCGDGRGRVLTRKDACFLPRSLTNQIVHDWDCRKFRGT